MRLLYSRRDAASALGIGITKLSDMIQKNEIETVRVGKRVMVKARSLYHLAGEEMPREAPESTADNRV